MVRKLFTTKDTLGLHISFIRGTRHYPPSPPLHVRACGTNGNKDAAPTVLSLASFCRVLTSSTLRLSNEVVNGVN